MSASGVGVVLVAAGQGTRLGADRPKALVPLLGTPVVAHALAHVLACPDVGDVVLVVPDGHEEEFEAAIEPLVPPPDGGATVRVVPGGAERTDSVAAGAAALPAHVDLVLVHDAARPLAPAELFGRVVATLRAGHDAVVPAVPVTDTVKQVNARGVVVATPDRSALRAVQTPQGFRRPVLEAAHRDTRATATDDATLVERGGGTVYVVPGDPRAAKLTGPADLASLEQILRAGRPPVLLVVGGLPGVGKTHVAREWARRRGAVHLRVDSIEQALLRAGTPEVGTQGYAVAHALAGDQLRLGLGVVVDAVHPVGASRAGWRPLAEETGVRCVAVELRCPDETEHRRRVEQRTADIDGHLVPDWSGVERSNWEPWPEADVVLDTTVMDAAAVADAVEALLDRTASTAADTTAAATATGAAP